MDIIFATGNKDKVVEVREILQCLGDNFTFRSMKEAGLNPTIVEDGSTFEENAMIKATTVAKAAAEAGMKDVLVLADDSGLCIDCLNGDPGIYSARFLGEDTSYRVKNAYLINKVNEEGKDNRKAQFVCAIAAVFPDGSREVVRGTVNGEICTEERGKNGFGYDPIFYLPERGKTTAELEPAEKHAISHRGNALRLMKDVIIKHENLNCQ